MSSPAVSVSVTVVRPNAPCVSSSMRPGAPVAVAAVTDSSCAVFAARRSERRATFTCL